jgi:hypothetical protein
MCSTGKFSSIASELHPIKVFGKDFIQSKEKVPNPLPRYLG